jgi:biotin carboxyl carrier protein
MFKAKINNSSYDVKFDKTDAFVDDAIFDWDITKLGDRSYHIISNNKSYRAEVVSIDHKTKVVILKLNGKKIEVALKDKFDLLLEKLGMDTVASTKMNEIKAPMPGLIFEIQIKVGDEVKKGDPIMILEAMKMENVLKSPGDGLVKAIKVKKGDSVEKNQVLVQF